MESGKIIVVANQKGGVAKTSKVFLHIMAGKDFISVYRKNRVEILSAFLGK